MTPHRIIYAWGDSPDSVTGQWSANTFYDESAEPYIPLAAIAAAYGRAAHLFALELEVREALGRTWPPATEGKISAIKDILSEHVAPADALAALERVKREAKNEALEAAAKYHDNFLMTQTGIPVEKVVASTEAIRAMKEPEE